MLHILKSLGCNLPKFLVADKGSGSCLIGGVLVTTRDKWISMVESSAGQSICNRHHLLLWWRGGKVRQVGVMEMGTIAPRARIEHIALTFWARVNTIAPPRLPDVTTLSMPTCLCGSLPERSVQATTTLVLLVL